MNFAKMSFLFVSLVYFVGCCPKNGVDKTFTVNDYALAVDYYSQGQPIEANLIAKNNTSVEVFDKDSISESSIYSVYDNEKSNRIVYYFNSSWSSEKINSIDVKLENIELTNINFNSIEKAVYQRASVPYNFPLTTTASFLMQVECFFQGVGSLIIPKAQAMSCRASDSSMIHYRPGTAIRIDLN